MNRIQLLGLLAIGFMAIAPAHSTQLYITNFNMNAQLATYCDCYPAQEDVLGFINDGNKYGTGSVNYAVNSVAGVNDAQLLQQGGTTSSSTPMLAPITSPTAIYLLIVADQPVIAQTALNIQLAGSGGYSQSFDLVNGSDVRCFVTNTACDVNTSNNINTRNVYSSPLGTIGLYGSGIYVLDEVRLILDTGWTGRTLSSINLTLPSGGANGQILLGGITVEASGPNHAPATPEPASFAMALGGAAALWIGRRRLVR